MTNATETTRVNFENYGTTDGDTEWAVLDTDGACVGLLRRSTPRRSGQCGYGQGQDSAALKSWTADLDDATVTIPDGATAAQAKKLVRLALNA